MKKCKCILTDFGYGFVIGVITAMILLGVIFGLIYVNHKSKERVEYVERQIEIEALREDYINRAIDEFLEIPDIRRAADGASDEFIRKRDEILQRFRTRIAD